MKTTIDRAGRIMVPKTLRDRVGLTGGQEIEITERDGRIEIEPACTPMSLQDDGDGLRAVPDRTLPPLTDEMVREVPERTRR
jgi:AbrB family looped-hinge helix DNA binding protein